MNTEKLYRQLSAKYSSVHFDSPHEKAICLTILESAILEDGFTENQILEKMDELMEAIPDDQLKSKLYTLIQGYFWERSYRKSIPYRPHTID